MNEPQNNKTRHWLIISILVATFFGFAAGFVSNLVSQYYLSNLALFQDLYLQNIEQLQDKNVIIQDPRKVVVEQDVRIEQLKSELRSSTVTIVRPRTGARTIIEEIFTDTDVLGHGMIITSDGWIATAESVPVVSGSVVVTDKKRLYEIKDIRKDAISGYQFIKIEAQNLPVMKFADAELISLTQTVVAYTLFDDQLAVSDIQSPLASTIDSRFDYVESSEENAGNIQITDALPDSFVGSPAVALGGAIIGIYTGDGYVNPITRMSAIIGMVLRGDDIVRPYLGINYIDISRVYGLSEDRLQGRTTGALIVQNRSGIAVAEDSPLSGEVTVGDIITKVEGQELDSLHRLSEVLQEFKPGDEITISYSRDGVTHDISAVLEEL